MDGQRLRLRALAPAGRDQRRPQAARRQHLGTIEVDQPGAIVELTLTVGYYMMVCRFLETTGVEGEEGQAEWLKTAKL